MSPCSPSGRRRRRSPVLRELRERTIAAGTMGKGPFHGTLEDYYDGIYLQSMVWSGNYGSGRMTLQINCSYYD